MNEGKRLSHDSLPQLHGSGCEKHPSEGIFRVIPRSLLPYAQLARIDKPGFVAVWVTMLIGVFQAASLRGTPLPDVFRLVVYLWVLCQFIMWFNFAWNDTCDARFDRQVPRTRNRPLARGALTLRQAIGFDLLLAGIITLLLLPLRHPCGIYAIPMAFGCLVYPLSKRVTNYPQVVLGIVGQTGIFLGAAAVGVDAVPYPVNLPQAIHVSAWQPLRIPGTEALWISYLTGVIWNVLFEIIYSYQDAEWDPQAGVGTITRKFGDHASAKRFLALLAVTQTALHLYTGSLQHTLSLSWIFSVSATALSLAFQIWRVDLREAESCLHWFKLGILTTGFSMLFGFVSEYLKFASSD